MSHPRSPFTEDHQEDDVATECVYCGSYIHAGSYPPLCSDYCRYWFQVECNHHDMAEKLDKQMREK